jgi:hypothetical protein
MGGRLHQPHARHASPLHLAESRLHQCAAGSAFMTRVYGERPDGCDRRRREVVEKNASGQLAIALRDPAHGARIFQLGANQADREFETRVL